MFHYILNNALRYVYENDNVKIRIRCDNYNKYNGYKIVKFLWNLKDDLSLYSRFYGVNTTKGDI